MIYSLDPSISIINTINHINKKALVQVQLQSEDLRPEYLTVNSWRLRQIADRVGNKRITLTQSNHFSNSIIAYTLP